MANLYFVVACGDRKAPAPAPARDLYTGSLFAHVLKGVEAEAAATARDLGRPVTVLVLSALHGLVTLDTVLAPYDVRMGDEGSVTAEQVADTAADLGIEFGDEVYAFLPTAYREVLAEALATDDVAVHDSYEAAPGVGYHRGVASTLARLAAA